MWFHIHACYDRGSEHFSSEMISERRGSLLSQKKWSKTDHIFCFFIIIFFLYLGTEARGFLIFFCVRQQFYSAPNNLLGEVLSSQIEEPLNISSVPLSIVARVRGIGYPVGSTTPCCFLPSSAGVGAWGWWALVQAMGLTNYTSYI